MGSQEVLTVLYEDKFGNLLLPEEVEEMAPWEIDELRVHISELYH